MSLSDFDRLLPDLATAFDIQATWRGGPFVLRLRVNPHTVSLNPTAGGLYLTEAWCDAELATIPRDNNDKLPDVGDRLTIGEQLFEIVELGDNDLQFRLL